MEEAVVCSETVPMLFPFRPFHAYLGLGHTYTYTVITMKLKRLV
jgi:hypothetical protein